MSRDGAAERHLNPHRPPERPPILEPHPFRPGAFGAGIALAGLGVVFAVQQLGAVALGPVTTIAVLTLALAGLLVAAAIGWSRRHSDALAARAQPDDLEAADVDHPSVGDLELGDHREGEKAE